MANEEHVQRLLAGVEEWNTWRERYREDIDLTGADLGRATLVGAELQAAHLEGASLQGASLERANLEGVFLQAAHLEGARLGRADLFGANLEGAHLQAADLRDVNLSNANLFNANLAGAILYRANLQRARLYGATLNGMRLRETMFSETDLRGTTGLLEIMHTGSSAIVLQTVLLPQDGSAVVFLRGAGVSDEWIDFYRSTMQHPLQYHSLFISYASEDQALASRLHADLQNNGVRCWFAPHDLVPGDHFREKIDQAIQMQDKLLLILSNEVRRVLNREVNQDRVVLFPIRIDEEVMQSTSRWARDLKENRHIGDFTEWESSHAMYQERFNTLLSQLRTESKRP